MKNIFNSARMIIAETLLSWILAIVPKDHPDGKCLIQSLDDYFRRCVDQHGH